MPEGALALRFWIKRRIPAKLKVAGTAIALLLAGLSYLGWKSSLRNLPAPSLSK